MTHEEQISLFEALALNGAWSNAACTGYCLLAMQRAGLDEKTIEKVLHRFRSTVSSNHTKTLGSTGESLHRKNQGSSHRASGTAHGKEHCGPHRGNLPVLSGCRADCNSLFHRVSRFEDKSSDDLEAVFVLKYALWC